VGNASERSEVCTISNALWRLGFTFKTNRIGEAIRIVGYSLNGAAIPVGETEICTLHNGNARITQVVLSDANADAIPASIEGIASGIQSLDYWTISQSDNCYDLSGRKLSNSKLSNSQLRKGVYIHNGTKIVNK
jgi:hypothetical protein